MKQPEEKEKLYDLLRCVEKVHEIPCVYYDKECFLDPTAIKVDISRGENESPNIMNAFSMCYEVMIVGRAVYNVNATSVSAIAEIATVECLIQNKRLPEDCRMCGYLGTLAQ